MSKYKGQQPLLVLHITYYASTRIATYTIVVYKRDAQESLVFTQFLVDFGVATHEMASQFILGLIFVLTFLASLYWRWTRSRFVQLINAIPGRDCLPVFGSLFDAIHLDPEG